MRTTVTLDPDVAALLRDEMEKTGFSFKQVLNQAIRRGLDARMGGVRRTVRTRPHDFDFKPGVDLDRLNQLADELEVEEVRFPAPRGATL